MDDAVAARSLAFLSRQQDKHDDHLVRARRLLERAIRQRWADGLISREADGAFSAALGPQEIDRLMRPPATGEIVEDHVYDPASPVGQLAAGLGLRPTEADLVAVLLACETDPSSARLVSYLAGTAGTAALTVDTLFEIAYRPRVTSVGQAAVLMHGDLAADGPARRLKFLVMDGTETRPFLSQGVRLNPRLTSWLLGRRQLDAELDATAKLLPPDPPPGELDPQLVERAAEGFTAGKKLLIVHGPNGAGRELLLRSAAHRLGRPLLLVNGRGLEADKLVAAFREATLHRALLAFRDAEEPLAGDARVKLRECLEVFPGSVALIGLGPPGAGVSNLRPLVEISVPVPPHTDRLRLWKRYLGESPELHAEHWREISGLYNLGIGGIVEAGRLARSIARDEKQAVSRRHVTDAVRQLFDSDLTVVARRMLVTQTWDDVVLPDEVVESVVDVVNRISFRNEVLGDWGFGRKVGKGLGLTVLFSGQPGTGKSMVAGLIAAELGLDLYVIDLSRIMSKWLGETEKNLARAFDAAEAGHVLLLFDEADTLLGRRTAEIRSANDRHANLETNFILARIESFQGIAVFTTNLASAIDPAIMRRMSANIAFPFPDVEARTELWRRMIPAEAPTTGRIDFGKLARYELSGGFIRNVVLRAAYLAAREGKPIGMDQLERAAKAEYVDRGSLTVGGRLA
ncbi:MAG TPA: AAA family ATPase [Kofleriaceae bacterium]|nr:AAA family ATPase [Kofleriaceae bacterium]